MKRFAFSFLLSLLSVTFNCIFCHNVDNAVMLLEEYQKGHLAVICKILSKCIFKIHDKYSLKVSKKASLKYRYLIHSFLCPLLQVTPNNCEHI